MPSRLILASASASRHALLSRLRIPFEVLPADIDETPQPDEPPDRLALRLSAEKARAVAGRHPDAWVIGSDQVGVCRGLRLEKPGTIDRAEAQLQWMQGDTAVFYSGLSLVAPFAAREWQAVEQCEVRLRELSLEEIRRYIDIERPLASAGSFLAEALGSALFQYIHGDDPTTLMGMPLIRLCAFLREAGLDPLKA